MKKTFNLGDLEWSLSGWTPHVWRQQRSIESGASLNAEVTAVPASVPGSVQGALRQAGMLPDWNVALDARLCEWVEHRHWIYTARVPPAWLESGTEVRLRALGLDYAGWVLVNGKEIGDFRGSFTPHVFDLSTHLRGDENVLQIVFDFPPRWLGQIGYTWQMTDWKPRFNYFWDWTSRLVQTGIWDELLLEVTDGQEVLALDCTTDADPQSGTGTLLLRGSVAGDEAVEVHITLRRDELAVREEVVPVEAFQAGMRWEALAVDLWWPNGHGPQPLYTLWCEVLDSDRAQLDEVSTRVGFKSLTWAACEGAPPGADPWLCVLNGRPVFLQGVNWTPILPNFADTTEDHYRRLLETYRDLGCILLRVWGGAFLEKEVFYDLCDEMGLLVWQEFPLSSSGLDNRPPDTPRAIDEMGEIAESYVERRRHHVCLALWCGGNELETLERRPVDTGHPMIARLAQVVARLDPGHRFLPTSPSGPRFGGDRAEFGHGVHWDVHGPWHVHGGIDGEWSAYWRDDDSLFRSEVGVAGASPVELIRHYKGDLPEMPASKENELWRRTSWWIDWPAFLEESGREPGSLEEFVGWSQERQRRALGVAARAAKARFPRTGGFLVWMGHDSFPCTANTSLIDFHGDPKPAAIEIGNIYRAQQTGGRAGDE